MSNQWLLEIKCFKTANHIETLLTEKIDRRYLLQTQWQMAVTQLPYVDFVAYNNTLPPSMRMFQRRLMRDERVIAEITVEVREFIDELNAKTRALAAKFGLTCDVEEWRTRPGWLGASCIADVMAKGKAGAPSASRANVMARLITERLTGVKQQTYQSYDMEYGIETEAEAADIYAFMNDVELVKPDFIRHPIIEFTGATPDRIVRPLMQVAA